MGKAKHSPGEIIEVMGRQLPEPVYVIGGAAGVLIAWRDVPAVATCATADVTGRTSLVLSFGRTSAEALRDQLAAALAR
ncbi:MAG TPA: hypothetical protein VLM76_02010 [Patescibacteria group bacterium]|nr:hypothetical protein [Patescibacteria group bacterium]